jgi:lipopolysaccharide transport system ATP-binding protein
VGIIGRNGAGKSTLLKILSRITEPTSGEIRVRGRIASLLEVGTGFHPELSGRENIFLNGAILGMTKAEIRAKFDEIVDFAGVEQFIDTPVKRYSSGMYVRLAFAVAAHLEPEILIVDEVLAVGDAEFQKKCLGKMKDVAGHGRTILFVSHNILAVQQLCQSLVIMQHGKLEYFGGVDGGIKKYLASYRGEETYEDGGWINLRNKSPSGVGSVIFHRMRFSSLQSLPLYSVAIGENFNVEIEFQTVSEVKGLIIGIAVHDKMEQPIFATHWNDFGKVYDLPSGTWRTECQFQKNYLRSGNYQISIGAIDQSGLCAHVLYAAILNIEEVLSVEQKFYDQRIGSLFIPMDWSKPLKIQ